MPPMPDELGRIAVDHLLSLSGPRKLIAIAGPPGAGKSTLAEHIRSRLSREQRSCLIVPMDGFHLDNSVLRAHGLLHRKGAPETFDAKGFHHLVARIAGGESGVVYPKFDRSRDIAIAGAGLVSDEAEFILFEGNYLLLESPPWSGLSRFWTFSISIGAPLLTLESRLLGRWSAMGLGEADARARLDENDFSNVHLVAVNKHAKRTP